MIKLLSSFGPDQGSGHLFAELKMGKELALPPGQGEYRGPLLFMSCRQRQA